MSIYQLALDLAGDDLVEGRGHCDRPLEEDVPKGPKIQFFRYGDQEAELMTRRQMGVMRSPYEGATSINENDPAAILFDQFCTANTFQSIIHSFQQLCDLVEEQPRDHEIFYQRLKLKLTSWKAQSLWSKLDKRAANREYRQGTCCLNTRVLVIGGGPCGLRTAIEVALMGGKAVVVEKRDRFSRNNVLHLWPYLITDLKALGAKKFFGKFCAGAIDHISIRALECILLKVALLMGVEIHAGVTFDDLREPPAPSDTGEAVGWRAKVSPADHPVSEFQFDVLIGADGKRNTLKGFRRKEFRGKLAIAITANFINRNTTAEASVEEISGVAFIFNQKFFKDLNAQTGIDLENIVYYKDDTHYFVMTAKKHSLLLKGVLIQDFEDPARLLSKQNVDQEALLAYAMEAADVSTRRRLPDLEFAHNHYGQPDVAMFDFTSMFAAEHASRVVERRGYKLLVELVGDSLLEPFWPTGSGLARGFLGALDAAWITRSWASGKMTPLEVMAERESIYQLLSQTTPENINKNPSQYTIDPNSRYPNLNPAFFKPHQVKNQYDGEDLAYLNQIVNIANLQSTRYEMIRDSHNLLKWFQRQLEPYRHIIKILDLAKSWQNGLGLCALIHKYRPELIDVHALDQNKVAENNQLAFDVSEREFGIGAITSGEAMARGDMPDKLSMGSYLSQFFEFFRKESIKPTKLVRPAPAMKMRSKPRSPSSKLAMLNKLGSRIRQRRPITSDSDSQEPDYKKENAPQPKPMWSSSDDEDNLYRFYYEEFEKENEADFLKRPRQPISSQGMAKKRLKEMEEAQTPQSTMMTGYKRLEGLEPEPEESKVMRVRREMKALRAGVRGQNKVSALAKDLADKFKGQPPLEAEKTGPTPRPLLQKNADSDLCYFCDKTVYLVERHTAEGLYFHRGCFRCDYCSTSLRIGGYSFLRTPGGEAKFYCHQHHGMKKTFRRPRKRSFGDNDTGSGGPSLKVTIPEPASLSPVGNSHLDGAIVKTPERIEYVTESEQEESEFEQTQHNLSGLVDEEESESEILELSRCIELLANWSSSDEMAFDDEDLSEGEISLVELAKSYSKKLNKTYQRRQTKRREKRGGEEDSGTETETGTVGASDADWESGSDTEKESDTDSIFARKRRRPSTRSQEAMSGLDRSKEASKESNREKMLLSPTALKPFGYTSIYKPAQPQEKKETKPSPTTAAIMKNRMAFFSVVSEPVRIDAKSFLGLRPPSPEKVEEEPEEIPVELQEEESPVMEEPPAEKKKHRKKKRHRRGDKHRLTAEVEGSMLPGMQEVAPVITVIGSSDEEDLVDGDEENGSTDRMTGEGSSTKEEEDEEEESETTDSDTEGQVESIEDMLADAMVEEEEAGSEEVTAPDTGSPTHSEDQADQGWEDLMNEARMSEPSSASGDERVAQVQLERPLIVITEQPDVDMLEQHEACSEGNQTVKEPSPELSDKADTDGTVGTSTSAKSGSEDRDTVEERELFVTTDSRSGSEREPSVDKDVVNGAMPLDKSPSESRSNSEPKELLVDESIEMEVATDTPINSKSESEPMDVGEDKVEDVVLNTEHSEVTLDSVVKDNVTESNTNNNADQHLPSAICEPTEASQQEETTNISESSTSHHPSGSSLEPTEVAPEPDKSLPEPAAAEVQPETGMVSDSVKDTNFTTHSDKLTVLGVTQDHSEVDFVDSSPVENESRLFSSGPSVMTANLASEEEMEDYTSDEFEYLMKDSLQEVVQDVLSSHEDKVTNSDSSVAMDVGVVMTPDISSSSATEVPSELAKPPTAKDIMRDEKPMEHSDTSVESLDKTSAPASEHPSDGVLTDSNQPELVQEVAMDIDNVDSKVESCDDISDVIMEKGEFSKESNVVPSTLNVSESSQNVECDKDDTLETEDRENCGPSDLTILVNENSADKSGSSDITQLAEDNLNTTSDLLNFTVIAKENLGETTELVINNLGDTGELVRDNISEIVKQVQDDISNSVEDINNCGLEDVNDLGATSELVRENLEPRAPLACDIVDTSELGDITMLAKATLDDTALMPDLSLMVEENTPYLQPDDSVLMPNSPSESKVNLEISGSKSEHSEVKEEVIPKIMHTQVECKPKLEEVMGNARSLEDKPKESLKLETQNEFNREVKVEETQKQSENGMNLKQSQKEPELMCTLEHSQKEPVLPSVVIEAEGSCEQDDFVKIDKTIENIERKDSSQKETVDFAKDFAEEKVVSVDASHVELESKDNVESVLTNMTDVASDNKAMPSVENGAMGSGKVTAIAGDIVSDDVSMDVCEVEGIAEDDLTALAMDNIGNMSALGDLTLLVEANKVHLDANDTALFISESQDEKLRSKEVCPDTILPVDVSQVESVPIKSPKEKATVDKVVDVKEKSVPVLPKAEEVRKANKDKKHEVKIVEDKKLRPVSAPASQITKREKVSKPLDKARTPTRPSRAKDLQRTPPKPSTSQEKSKTPTKSSKSYSKTPPKTSRQQEKSQTPKSSKPQEHSQTPSRTARTHASKPKRADRAKEVELISKLEQQTFGSADALEGLDEVKDLGKTQRGYKHRAQAKLHRSASSPIKPMEHAGVPTSSTPKDNGSLERSSSLGAEDDNRLRRKCMSREDLQADAIKRIDDLISSLTEDKDEERSADHVEKMDTEEEDDYREPLDTSQVIAFTVDDMMGTEKSFSVDEKFVNNRDRRRRKHSSKSGSDSSSFTISTPSGSIASTSSVAELHSTQPSACNSTGQALSKSGTDDSLSPSKHTTPLEESISFEQLVEINMNSDDLLDDLEIDAEHLTLDVDKTKHKDQQNNNIAKHSSPAINKSIPKDSETFMSPIENTPFVSANTTTATDDSCYYTPETSGIERPSDNTPKPTKHTPFSSPSPVAKHDAKSDKGISSDTLSDYSDQKSLHSNKSDSLASNSPYSPNKLKDAKWKFFSEAAQVLRIDPSKVFNDIPSKINISGDVEASNKKNLEKSLELDTNWKGLESGTPTSPTAAVPHKDAVSGENDVFYTPATSMKGKHTNGLSYREEDFKKPEVRKRLLPATPAQKGVTAQEIRLTKEEELEKHRAAAREKARLKSDEDLGISDAQKSKKRPESASAMPKSKIPAHKRPMSATADLTAKSDSSTMSSTDSPLRAPSASDGASTSDQSGASPNTDRKGKKEKKDKKAKEDKENRESEGGKKEKKRSFLSLLLPSRSVDRKEKDKEKPKSPPPEKGSFFKMKSPPLGKDRQTQEKPSAQAKKQSLERASSPSTSGVKMRSKNPKSAVDQLKDEDAAAAQRRSMYDEFAPLVEDLAEGGKKNKENLQERLEKVAPPPAKAPHTSLRPPTATILSRSLEEFETESEAGDDKISVRSFQAITQGMTEEELAKMLKKQQRAAAKRQKESELKRLRVAQEIQRHLEEVEFKQRQIEEKGIKIERALRGEGKEIPTNLEDAEKDESELMQDWFNVVHEKNMLVRYESELMVHARELELEDRQGRLEHQLRELMQLDDSEKTADKRDEEQKVLQEILEVVEQRDALVALLEEDRLKPKEAPNTKDYQLQ